MQQVNFFISPYLGSFLSIFQSFAAPLGKKQKNELAFIPLFNGASKDRKTGLGLTDPSLFQGSFSLKKRVVTRITRILIYFYNTYHFFFEFETTTTENLIRKTKCYTYFFTFHFHEKFIIFKSQFATPKFHDGSEQRSVQDSMV